MRALFLTSSVPPVPGRDVGGFYKRLRLMMGAVGQFAGGMEAVHLVSPAFAADNPDAAALSAEQSRHFGFPINTILLEKRERPKTFANHYLRGVLDAAEQPAFFGALPPAQIESLRILLDRGHDLVFVHRLGAMCALLRTGRDTKGLVFDMDDVEHHMHLRKLIQPPLQSGKFLSMAQIPALVAAEWRGAARADATFVCSETDRRKLRCQGFGRGIMVIPNAVEIAAQTPPLTTEPNLLYIGDFGYAPNREAAERLALRIFPKIREAVPSARLMLVGQRPGLLAAEVGAAPGVECLGFVESLDQVYGATRIVCCPLRNGGGTRLKLIEGAAYGKAMVSTRIGAEGLDFDDSTEILLRDDDAGFAEACAALLRDPALCLALGEAARRKAIAHYRADHIASQITDVLARVAAPHR